MAKNKKNLDTAISAGLSFGLTSGTITTLGLMFGLFSGTNSRLAVIGGILTIAIADALSDSLGIRATQESEHHSKRAIWVAVATTFFAKLIYASTFLIPILLLPLNIAVLVSAVYGFSVLGVLSFYNSNGKRKIINISNHVLLAAVVIVITYLVGKAIAILFT